MVSRISYDQTMQGLLGLRLKFCLSNGSLIRLVALGEENFMTVSWSHQVAAEKDFWKGIVVSERVEHGN